MPVRPFLHAGDTLGTRPGEALAADADAVAHRLAVAEHQIKVSVRRIDDDGAGRLLGDVIHELAAELRRQILARPGLGLLVGRQCGDDRVAVLRGRGRRRVGRRAYRAGDVFGSGTAGNIGRRPLKAFEGRRRLRRQSVIRTGIDAGGRWRRVWHVRAADRSVVAVVARIVDGAGRRQRRGRIAWLRIGRRVTRRRRRIILRRGAADGTGQCKCYDDNAEA